MGIIFNEGDEIIAILRGIQIDLITGDNNKFINWFNHLWDDQTKYVQQGKAIFYYIGTNDDATWVCKYVKDRLYYNQTCIINSFDLFFAEHGNYSILEIQSITELLIQDKLSLKISDSKWASKDLIDTIQFDLDGLLLIKGYDDMIDSYEKTIASFKPKKSRGIKYSFTSLFKKPQSW